MKKPVFSVIVPVYNVEKYLAECVDSILNQSFGDFELILVDDGSPDNCPAICDEYAAKDSRVRVIHKPNGGVSSARNEGIRAAGCDYILFCDSDDYYFAGAFEKIRNALLERKPDVLCFGILRESAGGNVCTQPGDYAGKVTDSLLLSVAYAGIAPAGPANVDVSPVNKLYKRSLLLQKQLEFDETLRIAEDISFNVPYLAACESIVCIPEALYFYRCNLNSAIHVDKGFAEKGMERSVYFLSKIQRTLETCVPREKLYPVAKNRYNRLVIDACSNQHKRKCGIVEDFHQIRNCCRWYRKYLEHYGIALSGVPVLGGKAKIEDLIIRNGWTVLIWLYTKAVHLYHNR